MKKIIILFVFLLPFLAFGQGRVTYFDAAAPTTTDDMNSGYFTGNFWIKTANEFSISSSGDSMWVCKDAYPSAAVWQFIGTQDGGGSGTVGISGTPLDNQAAFWTNATTIEGNSRITDNGTHLYLGGTSADMLLNTSSGKITISSTVGDETAIITLGTGYADISASGVSDISTLLLDTTKLVLTSEAYLIENLPLKESATHVLSTNAANDTIYRTTMPSAAGTVTSVSSSTTNQLTVANGTTTPALTIVTGAVANSATSLSTGDQIYDWVTAQSYLTGNETVTLSGDVTGSGTTAITTTIAANAVEESMLKSVNAPTDEYSLTYESTTGDFEWQNISGGGASQLSDLSDVGVTTATAGRALIADGDSWESVAVSGDVTMSGAGAVTIAANAIEESMLKSVNAPTDEYSLTYESTTGDFEWQNVSGGGGLPTSVEGQMYFSNSTTPDTIKHSQMNWTDADSTLNVDNILIKDEQGIYFVNRTLAGQDGKIWFDEGTYDLIELWSAGGNGGIVLRADNAKLTFRSGAFWSDAGTDLGVNGVAWDKLYTAYITDDETGNVGFDQTTPTATVSINDGSEYGTLTGWALGLANVEGYESQDGRGVLDASDQWAIQPKLYVGAAAKGISDNFVVDGTSQFEGSVDFNEAVKYETGNAWKTGNNTAGDEHYILYLDGTTGNDTLTMPSYVSDATVYHREYRIICKTEPADGSLLIRPAVGEYLEGALNGTVSITLDYTLIIYCTNITNYGWTYTEITR